MENALRSNYDHDQKAAEVHSFDNQATQYRQQIENAVFTAAEYYRDRTYRETLKQILATLQTLGEKFNQAQDTEEALILYEVLVSTAIAHYNTLDTGYLIFTPVLA